jgi:hypothetical protein
VGSLRYSKHTEQNNLGAVLLTALADLNVPCEAGACNLDLCRVMMMMMMIYLA